MKEVHYDTWRCYLLILLILVFGVGAAWLFWPALLETRWGLLLYIVGLAVAVCPLRAVASFLLNCVARRRGDPIPYRTWREKLRSELQLW